MAKSPRSRTESAKPASALSGKAVRKEFERARDVHPVGITGKETPTQIIERMFPAYVGRQERTAFELMQQERRARTAPSS